MCEAGLVIICSNNIHFNPKNLNNGNYHRSGNKFNKLRIN
jgi:hypothetical protein